MTRITDRAQEIRKPVVLNNQRPGALDPYRKPDKSAWRMARPGNDQHYLAALRDLGCILGCADGLFVIDVHHLKSAAAARHRGVMLRAPDQFATPVCRMHHEEIERLPGHKEIEYFQARGVTVHLYARQSWRSWQTFRDPQRLQNLFTVYQQEAIRRLSRQVASGRRSA